MKLKIKIKKNKIYLLFNLELKISLKNFKISQSFYFFFKFLDIKSVIDTINRIFNKIIQDNLELMDKYNYYLNK